MASQEMRYLKRARQVADQMCSDFASPQGDFFLALDNEELLVRGKEALRWGRPSGNSIATYVLHALPDYRGERDHQRARAALEAAFSRRKGYRVLTRSSAWAADMLKDTPGVMVLNDGGDDELAMVMRKAIDSASCRTRLHKRGSEAEASCKELPHLSAKGTEKGR